MRHCLLVFCLLWSSFACISTSAQEPEPGLDHTLFRLPIPGAAVVTPDLVQLIIGQPQAAELLFFDSMKEKLTRKLELEFQPGAMALRDESLFVAGVESSIVHELNWKTGKVVRQLSIAGDGQLRRSAAIP